VDLEAVLGFAGAYRLARWAPLVVTALNRGEDIVGLLEVAVTNGDEFRGNIYTSYYRHRLELPGNSRKRFFFTVYLESFTHPLVVRVSAGGREVARRVIDLRHKFTTSRVILAVSRDANLDYLGDSRGESIRVFYPHPALLPDRWLGYDGVDAVIIHGVSLEHLSARQFEALEKWLMQGGILAVSGGPDYTLLRTPRLAHLLPGAPLGLLRFTDGSALAGAFAEPPYAPMPFSIHRVEGRRGRVLYSAGENPLVIEEERGRGRVLYLTFDVAGYPFDRWGGLGPLWLRLLKLPGLEPLNYRGPEEQSGALTVMQSSAGGFPDHTTVFLFCSIYVGLLAVGYRLVREDSGRRLIPWVTYAAPLLFAPAAYFIFGPLLFPPGTTAVAVSILEPLPHTGYAEFKLDLGLYSTKRRRFLLEYRGPQPLFQPFSWKRGSGYNELSWIHHEGRRPSLETVADQKYVFRVLKGRDIIPYRFSASGRQTERGIHLEVKNDTGYQVREAWLVYHNRAYALGALPGDGVTELMLSAADHSVPVDPDAWADFLNMGEGGRESPKAEVAARRLKRALVEAAVDERRRDLALVDDSALLVGFTASPLRLSGESAAWQRRDVALVVAYLPVEPLPMRPGEWDYDLF